MQYFLLPVLLFLSAFLTAQTQPEPDADGVYETVEQMPTFIADCPEGEDYKPCADLKMLEYVYENVRYPEEAKDADKEGMAVVSFVVEKDGTISSPAIYRNPGYGMGEEVLRIVSAMNDAGPRWNPGTQDGEPVRVEFKLPVKFSLGK